MRVCDYVYNGKQVIFSFKLIEKLCHIGSPVNRLQMQNQPEALKTNRSMACHGRKA